MIKKMLPAIFILAFCAAAYAEDPLVAAPERYKKLFENDRVRVMEVYFNPGDKIKPHSHPDHFVTVLEPGKLKIFKPDGSASEVDLAKEQVLWIPAETHWAENTGKTRITLLVSELKK